MDRKLNELEVKAIETIAEELKWNVEILDRSICFQKYSSAGHDFNVEVAFKDLKELQKELNDYADNYDPSQETYLWLDSSGHGKNGSPYYIKDLNIKDLYEDFEECKENLDILAGRIETIQDLINKLEEKENKIAIIWGIDDVKQQDPTLTDEQAREVLKMLYKYHDANIGINWDVIDSTISIYRDELEEEEEEEKEEEKEKFEMLKEQVEEISEKEGWNFTCEDNIFDFQKYSAGGQNFSVEIKCNTLEELIEGLEDYIDNFDISYETYQLLDSAGHGTDAIENMKELYEDFENVLEDLTELKDAIKHQLN